MNKKARLDDSSQEFVPAESFVSLNPSTSRKRLNSDGCLVKDLRTSFGDSSQSFSASLSLAQCSNDSDESLKEFQKSTSPNADVLLEDFKPFISQEFISLPGDQSSLRPIKY